MDQYLLDIFVKEVKLQCRFGLEAYNAMVQILERINDVSRTPFDERIKTPLDPDGNNVEIFFYSYSFLVHAAIVSKILWPGTKVFPKEKLTVGPDHVEFLESTRAQRGPALRLALKIREGLAIADKSLRDDLEHYDERIEAWYLASPRRNIVDMNLMPRSAVQGIDQMDFRRNLDPSTMSFFIEGSDYEFQKMANELKDIYVNCAEWLNRNDRHGQYSQPDKHVDQL